MKNIIIQVELLAREAKHVIKIITQTYIKGK